MSGSRASLNADGPRVKVGIIGSGNIGTDLMLKLLRSPLLEPCIEVGIDEASKGLQLAREKGIKTSARGIGDLLKEDIAIVYDASGAKPHLKHAPLLKEAGKIAIDLTPAAVGPYVVPYINLRDHLDADNVNLITCGAQATVPIVYSISRVAAVSYAEIVSSVASKSAGLGTRQNIDEFTQTTARSLEALGGAGKGKAIIVLNPAKSPSQDFEGGEAQRAATQAAIDPVEEIAYETIGPSEFIRSVKW